MALSALALLGSYSGLISLIMAIVAKVLVKPYKEVTEKPVSIFVKITNILSIVTIILSILAILAWVIGGIMTLIGGVLAGGAGLAIGGEMIDLDTLLEEIFDMLGLI